eukprot:611438-Prymnesium_polylepis.1
MVINGKYRGQSGEIEHVSRKTCIVNIGGMVTGHIDNENLRTISTGNAGQKTKSRIDDGDILSLSSLGSLSLDSGSGRSKPMPPEEGSLFSKVSRSHFNKGMEQHVSREVVNSIKVKNQQHWSTDARSAIGQFLGQRLNVPIKPRNQNVGPPPADSGLDKIIIKVIEGKEFNQLDKTFSPQAKKRVQEMYYIVPDLNEAFNLKQSEPDVYKTIVKELEMAFRKL